MVETAIETVMSGMSEQDLNKIALSGGRICQIEPDEFQRADSYIYCHGYGVKAIYIDDDQAILVLTAKSPLANEYLRQGRINYLMDTYELEYYQADMLFSVASEIKGGMNRLVLDKVVNHKKAYQKYGDLRSPTDGNVFAAIAYKVSAAWISLLGM